MDFEFVDSGWEQRLGAAFQSDLPGMLLVSPFIKHQTIARLLGGRHPGGMKVLTRFCKPDFFQRVSDTSALRLLLERGAQIRGIRDLHAKLYVFGTRRAIVTSANLTDAALSGNIEFGCEVTSTEAVSACRRYFESLWDRAGPDLDLERIQRWEHELATLAAEGARPSRIQGLIDEGAVVFAPQVAVPVPVPIAHAPQAFIKFFGSTGTRADRALTVFEEVRGSGCHFACTYPKRPRQVESGAVMYVARLVRDPDDILVYGRGIAMEHVDDRDVASDADLQLRPWKRDWPYYIRVHSVGFVAGRLSNGVSLNALMDQLGPRLFASTERRVAEGETDVNPRLSLRRQPGVRLSAQGQQAVAQLLEQAFSTHGRLQPADLEQLDWPAPTTGTGGPRYTW